MAFNPTRRPMDGIGVNHVVGSLDFSGRIHGFIMVFFVNCTNSQGGKEKGGDEELHDDVLIVRCVRIFLMMMF